MDGSRETMCARCAHLQVCMNKEQFLTAQQAVDDLEVIFGTTKDNAVAMIKLRSIPWIKPTNLVCNNFLENRLLTRVSEAMENSQQIFIKRE